MNTLAQPTKGVSQSPPSPGCFLRQRGPEREHPGGHQHPAEQRRLAQPLQQRGEGRDPREDTDGCQGGGNRGESRGYV